MFFQLCCHLHYLTFIIISISWKLVDENLIFNNISIFFIINDFSIFLKSVHCTVGCKTGFWGVDLAAWILPKRHNDENQPSIAHFKKGFKIQVLKNQKFAISCSTPLFCGWKFCRRRGFDSWKFAAQAEKWRLAVWWLRVDIGSLLSSILAFTTDLQMNSNSTQITLGICPFGAWKTLTTRWSGCRVQVWVPVRAPACHLASAPEDYSRSQSKV